MEACAISDDEWTVAEAKADLDEVVEKARLTGPQTITRSGRRVAVVVSAEAWDRHTARKDSLVEFFANSPLRGSGIKIERIKGGLRDVDL